MRTGLPYFPTRCARAGGCPHSLRGGADVADARVETPVAFKEGRGEWVKAVPADTLQRGPWWELFGDPASTSSRRRWKCQPERGGGGRAYAQARALVAEQRARCSPRWTCTRAPCNGSRSGGGSTPTAAVTGRHRRQWEPDVWGRLRAGCDGARAGEQASLADLQAAKLSAQGELASKYFNLRELDAPLALQAETIAGYSARSRSRRTATTPASSPAPTCSRPRRSWPTRGSELLGLERQRASWSMPSRCWWARRPPISSWLRARSGGRVPDIPFDVPSTLLQRRPDIAAAERRVPRPTSRSASRRRLTSLACACPSRRPGRGPRRRPVQRLGAGVVCRCLAGANDLKCGRDRRARGRRPRGPGRAAARYRQTVLSAFQDVEDQLVASRVLHRNWRCASGRARRPIGWSSRC